MKKEIKKYKPNYALQISHNTQVIFEDPDGDLVLLEDYEELKKRI